MPVSVPLPSTLRYRLRYPSLINIADPDDPALNLVVTPAFESFNPDVRDDCVVFDVPALFDTLENGGTNYLLTRECGWAEDVDIGAPISVRVTPAHIEWTLELQHYHHILRAPWCEQTTGTLTLQFYRAQYRRALWQLLHDLYQVARNGVCLATLKQEDITRGYGQADPAKILCGLDLPAPPERLSLNAICPEQYDLLELFQTRSVEEIYRHFMEKNP